MADNQSLTFSEYLKRTKPLLWLSVVGFFILGTLTLIIGNEGLFLWLNKNLTPKYGNISIIFTELGSSWPMVWLVAFCVQKPIRKLLSVGFTWFFGACFSWLFKLWLMSGSLRPFKYFLEKGILLNTVEGVEIHHYNSFPSGHTLTAFSAAFVFLFVRNSTLPPGWNLLLWTLAMGCGLSRIVLVQHWPTDILGGMIFGSLAAFLSVWVSVRLPEKDFLNRSLRSLFPF